MLIKFFLFKIPAVTDMYAESGGGGQEAMQHFLLPL